MSESHNKYLLLIKEVKKNQDKSPIGSLRVFVHFLKEMKKIVKEAPLADREKIFQEFYSEQKEFEQAMHGLKNNHEKMSDPAEREKIHAQVSSPEFQLLVKQMSEELMGIVKLMTEVNAS